MADQDTSSDAPTHHPGTRQGEEMKEDEGKEAGRSDEGTTHADRPSGGSDARDSTAINPDQVESGSDSPNMPPA